MYYIFQYHMWVKYKHILFGIFKIVKNEIYIYFLRYQQTKSEIISKWCIQNHEQKIHLIIKKGSYVNKKKRHPVPLIPRQFRSH